MNSGQEANLILSFAGQLFNFIVLFALLKIFVFNPFSKVLDKRRSKIKDGIEKAEKAEKKIEELRELEKKLKLKNEEERKKVLTLAEEEAKKRKEKTLEALEQVKKEILLNAQREAEDLKESEKGKTKRETIDNSILLAEKILKEKIDSQRDKELINDYLKSLK